MITLHAFSSMFPGGVGETKDMRVQWALEEMGLAYRVRGWDYAAGECDTAAFQAEAGMFDRWLKTLDA